MGTYEIRLNVKRMFRVYSMLHPEHTHSQDVVWEMNSETALDFAKEFGISAPIVEKGPVEWLMESAEEITFLGIKVILVDQPGIRLVFKVV